MNVAEIKGKYAIDGYLDIPKEIRLKIFDHVKQTFKKISGKEIPMNFVNKFIRDFQNDLWTSFKENENWNDVASFIEKKVKQIDVNPYSDSYGRAVTKKGVPFGNAPRFAKPGSKEMKLLKKKK